jgi:hypothetical protein
MGYLNQNFDIMNFHIYNFIHILKLTIEMSHKNYQQP